MKKAFTLLLTIILTTVMLSGCTVSSGSSKTTTEKTTVENTDSTTPSPKPSKPVTLRFWQAGGDTAGASEKMSELINKFTEKYPNITVEYQAIAWAEDPHTKFQAAIVANDIADLLIVGSPFDFVLANSDQIISLDKYIDDTFKNDLQFVNECTYTGKNEKLKGKLISVPLFGDARTIVYNKDLFKKAGVPEPTTSWTHEEFYNNAAALTKKIDGVQVYGFGTSARYASQYLPFVWNLGGEILNEDMTKSTVNTPSWKAAIEYYKKFFDNNITPPGSVNINLADIQKMFANGEVAMFVTTQDYVKELMKDPTMKDKIGVGQMPHEQKQTAFAGADVFVIPVLSKNPDEAAQLLKFLVSTDNQVDYCKTVGFIPSLKSAASNPAFTEDPIKKVFTQAVSYGKYYVKSEKASTITTILRGEIQSAISNQKTIDQALQDIDKAINDALKQ